MGKRYKVSKPEEVKTEEVALDTAIKNVEKKRATETVEYAVYAIVNASAVNVRQKPDIESASVDILKQGDRVQIGKVSGEFTFIFYGNGYSKAGYMMSKYLKEVK